LPAIDKDVLLTTKISTAYYIAFGPHGPRRPPPPGEGRQVFFISAGCVAAAFTLFAFTRMFANPVRPRTMTKEWQEASEEYLKVRYRNADIAAHLFCNSY
jgi:cytochrome c oxidase subunit 4